MIPANLMRLAGLAAVLVGVFACITELLDLYLYATASEASLSELAQSPTFAIQSVFLSVLAMLLLVALVGLYASQAEAVGVLGSVGFLVALVGTALFLGAMWYGLFFLPALAQAAPGFLDADLTFLENVGNGLSTGLLVVGWLLFAFSTLRARVYPRAAAVLLLVGTVVGAIPLPLTTVLFGAAVAWMGVSLLRGVGTGAGQPSRVR